MIAAKMILLLKDKLMLRNKLMIYYHASYSRLEANNNQKQINSKLSNFCYNEKLPNQQDKLLRTKINFLYYLFATSKGEAR